MTKFVVTLFPFRHQVTIDAGDVVFAADMAHDLVPDADFALVTRLDDKPHKPDPWNHPEIKVIFR